MVFRESVSNPDGCEIDESVSGNDITAAGWASVTGTSQRLLSGGT
jgi:hypothetical protein